MRFLGIIPDHWSNVMLRINLRATGLNPQQKIWNNRDRCYRSTLWDDRPESNKWSRKYNDFGAYIPRDQRVPEYIDPIGKEIVEDLASTVAAEGKFPAVQLSANADVFSSQSPADMDNIVGDSDGSRDKESLEKINSSLAQLFQALAASVKLQQRWFLAVKRALVIESAIVVFKLKNGRPTLDVIDRTFLQDLKMDPDRPGWVKTLTEQYVYEDTNTSLKDGMQVLYWYRRIIDGQFDRIWDRVPADNNGAPPALWGPPTEEVIHNLGFCPAVICTNDYESVFDGPMVGNIQRYVEMEAETDCTLIANQDPQPYILDDNTAAPAQKPGGGGSKAPSMQYGEGIWRLKGKSVGMLQADMSGVTIGIARGQQKRQQIKDNAHVIEVLPDDNQQSGVAITNRFTPKLNYLATLRTNIGECLENLIAMMLAVLAEYTKRNEKVFLKSQQDLQIPISPEIMITLVWPEMMPKTTQNQTETLGMLAMAEERGYISHATGATLFHQSIGLDDSETELEKVEKEREEAGEKESAGMLQTAGPGSQLQAAVLSVLKSLGIMPESKPESEDDA